MQGAPEPVQEKFELLKFKLDMGWKRPAPEEAESAAEPEREKRQRQYRPQEPAQTLLEKCERRVTSLTGRHRRKGFDAADMTSEVIKKYWRHLPTD